MYFRKRVGIVTFCSSDLWNKKAQEYKKTARTDTRSSTCKIHAPLFLHTFMHQTSKHSSSLLLTLTPYKHVLFFHCIYRPHCWDEKHKPDSDVFQQDLRELFSFFRIGKLEHYTLKFNKGDTFLNVYNCSEINKQEISVIIFPLRGTLMIWHCVISLYIRVFCW